MPKPISIVPYAKKSVLVCEPEDEERLEWLNKTLSKLGATRTRSIDRPGWILPRENEEKFKTELVAFEKGSKQHRVRRRSSESEDPKIKHSRKKPANADSSKAKSTKYFEPEEVDTRRPKSKADVSIKDEDSKDHIARRPRERDSKTPYIEWEDARDYNSHRDGSESDRDRSDEESDGNSTSDDELIQLALARKMKSESSQKEIDDEEIKDSDEEDAVSYSRRLRHVYKVLADYRKRIVQLEQAAQPTIIVKPVIDSIDVKEPTTQSS